ncbi:MAG: hypothetical protein MZV70_03440 [Desulfobacterales bacterium]|nr:hypothetical protein [Desulfobacterales bacterium]
MGEIAGNLDAYWVGMGDFIENAPHRQQVRYLHADRCLPREQINYICDILTPIAAKRPVPD